jgi:hypothetical protein
MKLEDYQTVKSAAEETGIEYKALLGRITRGTVAAQKLGDKIFLIHNDEVKRLKREKLTGSAQC